MTLQLAIDGLVVGWGHLGSLPSVLSFLCLSSPEQAGLAWSRVQVQVSMSQPGKHQACRIPGGYLSLVPALRLLWLCVCAQ